MLQKKEFADPFCLINSFIENVQTDPRITSGHISLYVSLISAWQKNGQQNPLIFFSKEIMPVCKISGVGTYHKNIRALHEYGYINYFPSFNHFEGSQVYIKL